MGAPVGCARLPTARLPRKDGPEQDLFPGFCALLLAAFGAMAAPRGLKKTAAAYTVLAVVGIVLSLGPDGIRPLYTALVQRAVRHGGDPGVRSLQCAGAVPRSRCWRRWRVRAHRDPPSTATRLIGVPRSWRSRSSTATASIAFPAAPDDDLERRAMDPRSARIRRGDLSADECLRRQHRVHAAVARAWPGRGQWLQWRPAAVFRGARRRDEPRARRRVAAGDARAWRGVRRQRSVPWRSTLALAARSSSAPRSATSTCIRSNGRPTIESALRAASEVPPPEPGPPPFAVGESATYRVRWAGGPLNIPAGEATISVAPPQASESFRFVVSAADRAVGVALLRGRRDAGDDGHRSPAAARVPRDDRRRDAAYRPTGRVRLRASRSANHERRHVDYPAARRRVPRSDQRALLRPHAASWTGSLDFRCRSATTAGD